MTPRAARSCTTVLDVLRACEEWFDGHPERWCQEISALGRFNMCVDPSSEHARKCCTVGAIVRFSTSMKIEDAAFAAIRSVINETSILAWNDRMVTKHADIVAAFRAAREREERRGG